MLLKWKCKKWRRRRWRKDVIYGKQRNVDSAAKGSIVPETSAQWPNVPLHSSHCPYQSDQLCKEDENIFDKQSITFFYMLRYCQSQPHLCILWCQIEVDFWILWCRRRGWHQACDAGGLASSWPHWGQLFPPTGHFACKPQKIQFSSKDQRPNFDYLTLLPLEARGQIGRSSLIVKQVSPPIIIQLLGNTFQTSLCPCFFPFPLLVTKGKRVSSR